MPPDEFFGLVWDAGLPGMAVRISALKKKTFYVVKRQPEARQPTWAAIGAYPLMTLAQAREAARDALFALERGEHPKALAKAKRRAAREAQRDTFKAVAERYMQHLQTSNEPPRPSTLRMYNGYLEGHLFPALGDRPVSTITRKDVLDVLDAVKERSGAASALGAKSLLGAVLNWAADRAIIPINPAANIKAKTLVGRGARARDRALTDAELRIVWNTIPAVGEPFASVYRLLLLTGCRLTEIAHAKWDELDLDKGVLTIPAERSKNGLTMLVPLPPKAVEIFQQVKRQMGPFIFSTLGGKRPVTAYSHFKAKLDAALAANGAKVEPFCVHDFRRTFRTGLSALRIPQPVAEAALNHKKAGIVGVYDVHEYFEEKADALRRWELYL